MMTPTCHTDSQFNLQTIKSIIIFVFFQDFAIISQLAITPILVIMNVSSSVMSLAMHMWNHVLLEPSGRSEDQEQPIIMHVFPRSLTSHQKATTPSINLVFPVLVVTVVREIAIVDVKSMVGLALVKATINVLHFLWIGKHVGKVVPKTELASVYRVLGKY